MSAAAMVGRQYLRSPGFWAQAFRAYSFPASIVPVVLGGAYAYYATQHFHWLAFVLSLLAGNFYHSACNLINDYYDYKHGVDRAGTYGGSGTLLSGQLKPREALLVAAGLIALGTLLGLYLIWYLYQAYGQGAALTMLAIGAAGLLGVVYYTATPLSAKYHALGEPLVFIMFGPGYVLGTYLIQTGHLSWGALWVSIPVGFIVTAILQANDTRDLSDDREARIRTASIIFGPTGARSFLSALYFAPYITLVILAATRVVPWPALVALLTLPLALKLHQLFWRIRAEKSELLLGSVENTAKLHMAFGMLMSIGVLIGAWMR